MKLVKAWAGGWIALLALAAVAGCGADGGVGGTGISTITGNVTLNAASHARVSTSVEGITVGVRGTDAHTLTDRRGEFTLSGEFDGDIIVEFTELDGTRNQLPLAVHPSWTFSLRNVRFDRGAATAERIDVDFEAIIAEDASCNDNGSNVLVSDREERNTYVVLLDGADYEKDDVRCDGVETPGCPELIANRTVRILGTQSAGPIEATRVRLVNCRIPGH